jgi:hypothetical protein
MLPWNSDFYAHYPRRTSFTITPPVNSPKQSAIDLGRPAAMPVMSGVAVRENFESNLHGEIPFVHPSIADHRSAERPQYGGEHRLSLAQHTIGQNGIRLEIAVYFSSFVSVSSIGTVHQIVCPRDETSLLGQEETHKSRDLFRFSPPAHWLERCHASRTRRLEMLRQKWGFDPAGTNGIYADTQSCILHRSDFRQSNNPVLGRGVCRRGG